MLDNNRAIGVPLELGGIHIADRKVVHAKDPRSPSTAIRVRTEPRADRSQLLDRSRYRLELLETRPSGRRHLAAAGGVGRGPAGRSAVRALPAPPLRNPPAYAGLCESSPGTAIPSSPDPATAVGGIPPEPPQRLRLQPLLRTLPSLAPPSGRRAPPRAQGRRETLRRLRRGQDPRPRPPGRSRASGLFVCRCPGRQQLYLCRSHLEPRFGRLAGCSRPHLRISRRCSQAGHPR